MKQLGLSSNQAGLLLKQYGLNEIAKAKRLPGVILFLSKFKNPLVLILLTAAVIAAFSGDGISSGIIIAIVLISVILDFVNTYRSQKAAEALKERVEVKTRVWRDGQLQDLSMHLLVPGDIVELSAGDIIPADGKVLEENDLFLNESQLTGESFPVEKPVDSELFLGSNVVTGSARMQVVQTGPQTQFNKIARVVAGGPAKTEFDRSIRDFSMLIMKITFLLVIFIFFINALLKGNVLESFLFAAALAVGLTPELLPAIIALNLSKGSLAMSKHGVIVKKLSAIENFGSMDVLCTDKTGTLTEDNIVLVKYVDGTGKVNERVFELAYISASFRSGFKNPLDAAVKRYKHIDTASYAKIDEIPFDYERKRDSVVVEYAHSRLLITKGAPEEMFKVCTGYGVAEHFLSPEILLQLQQEYQALSRDGFRVLGVAYRQLPDKKASYSQADEQSLVFAGFMAFLDPPKKSVTETLRTLEQYGIEIKILTGDNDLVTQKIASEIDLPVKGVLRGSDLESMNDFELAKKAELTTIFSRVTPEQKRRIITVLQRRHVVGFMGDGINDAPSLKTADVSISVDNAVDVAKESADLILLNKSLHDLINGVIEGRKTFVNTLKYLMMALSSNFGNMFSMAGASLFFSFLPMLPEQILFNNLLYDASQFTIPLDNVDKDELRKPRKLNIHFIRKFMLVFGPISSIFDFATFGILYLVFHLSGSQFQTGWFLESLSTQALVIFVIRTREITKRHTGPNAYLSAAVIAAVAAGWIAALTGIGALFKFTPLPFPVLASLAATTILYLAVVEFAKRKFYKKVSV